jgi:hypothetical protein
MCIDKIYYSVCIKNNKKHVNIHKITILNDVQKQKKNYVLQNIKKIFYIDDKKTMVDAKKMKKTYNNHELTEINKCLKKNNEIKMNFIIEKNRLMCQKIYNCLLKNNFVVM